MIRYIGRRLAWALVVVFAITVITFGVTFLSPVDPARLYAGLRATHAQYEVARRQLGLNHTILVQYFLYVGRLLHGNLGTSYSTGSPVLSLVMSRLPATLELAAARLESMSVMDLESGLDERFRLLTRGSRVALPPPLATPDAGPAGPRLC